MSAPLRLVIVTPERILLDEQVDALRFPLYDGQIGILPGRAPLVGQLGAGELKIDQGSTSRSYFIDGGFVQIKGPVVSILTHAAIPAMDLNVQTAEADLQKALHMPAHTDAEFDTKQDAQDRARRMIDLAKHK